MMEMIQKLMEMWPAVVAVALASVPAANMLIGAAEIVVAQTQTDKDDKVVAKVKSAVAKVVSVLTFLSGKKVGKK